MLLAWSPFPQCGFAAGFEDEVHAIAYAWHNAPATPTDLPASTRSVRLPESLMRSAPPSDGAWLSNCTTGCEGEIWLDGRLRSCRYWPAIPALAEWQNFLRAGAVQDGDAAVPSPAARTLLHAPRLRIYDLDGLRPGPGRVEQAVVAAVLAGLVLFTADFAGTWWRYASSASALHEELTALQPQANLISTQQAQADTLLADARSFSGSLPGVSPLDVIAHLQHLLIAAGNVRLHELEWINSGSGVLRIKLASDPKVTRTALLSALGSGWFAAVREEDQALQGQLISLRLEGSDQPVPREDFLDPGLAASLGTSPAAAPALPLPAPPTKLPRQR
jgi:hypothetical protein